TRGHKLGDWALGVHPDGRVRFINFRKDGEDPKGSHVSRTPLVVPDTWAHIVATWDGKANTLFVNGVEVPHDASTTATGWQTGHEVARSGPGPGYFGEGALEDLAASRRALSTAEVGEMYKADPHLKVATTVAPAGDPKVSQALDRLILARLKEEKLTPAPAADDA